MKKRSSQAVIDWRKRTKIRIVESMGGKCVCCTYNRSVEALELHHLDREDKNFGFGGIRANPKSWDKIVVELRKCVLVCSNCHKEIEYCGLEVPRDAARFDERYADYRKLNL